MSPRQTRRADRPGRAFFLLLLSLLAVAGALALVATFVRGRAGVEAGARPPVASDADRTREASAARRPPPPEPVSPELTPFAERYGPARQSENGEEWLVRDFFHDRRGGFFVDIGASDYRVNSNTHFLETGLGWSGIAVDALAEFAEGYRLHRPRTRFFAFFASDRSDAQATLYFHERNTLVSSKERSFTERWGADPKTVQVPTITLTDLLDGEGVRRIDFLSIDIELAEPQALAGFDVRRFRPGLVCIEAHAQVRQQILDYFWRNRYVVVGRYLRADTKNLWFAPLDDSASARR